jgi:MoCo/4Fe-4S cofactor protein with predicted Tat translocation signal
MNPLVQIQTSKETGPQYWRSLNQLTGTEEFKQWARQEFGPDATSTFDGASRRNILKLMAASFGLAGVTACRRPVEKILPNAKGVEDYIPGRAYFYSTAMKLGPSVSGLLVETHDGRPTKIEGNPEHPFSLGAANAFQQASILSLYDPDRVNGPMQGGQRITVEQAEAYLNGEFSEAKIGRGAGLRILSETVTSPSLAALRTALLTKFPEAKWVEWDSISTSDAVAGAQLAFGQPVATRNRVDQADIIVALDADFLGIDSGTVVHMKEFAKRRRIAGPESTMNRLYVAESQFSVTGAGADHRMRVKASEIRGLVSDVAKALGIGGNQLTVAGQGGGERRQKFVAAIVKDLQANRGKSLVIAGPRQPAAVQALVHLINQNLGNVGTTVVHYRNPDAPATVRPQIEALKELAGELSGGRVSQLVVLGGNPAFTAPADLNLADNLKKAGSSVYLGLEYDETSAAVKVTIPETHYLEAWGDQYAADGTVTIQQPMIQPLYGGARSALELVAQIAGYKDRRGYDIVRNYWNAKFGGTPDAATKAWRKALHDGVIASTWTPAAVTPDAARVLAAQQGSADAGGMEVIFPASWNVFDGRFANNAWMQEAPDPMTKLTWDNAALVSPATAKKLGVGQGDMITIERGGKSLNVPAFIMPGQAEDSITIPVGYGRSKVGRVGTGTGFNAYAIRTSDTLGFGTGFNVRKGTGSYRLVTTQDHFPIVDELGREEQARRAGVFIREATIEEYKKQPDFVKHYDEHPPLVSLYESPANYEKGYQWGMAIDLNSCVGCNACTVACQSENNIPVVGKTEVARGREMHWIRLDRYFKGDQDEPEAVTQPTTCMQCENAPCENVCPVAATVHSPEGLNDMVYNRCVGTRYCSNNCPYKVRRFNFLNWHKDTEEVQQMVFNPDVTVRMRGIMEKCTYCVQRIQEKKIQAKSEGRRLLQDGEVQPACMQTCPTEAIVFGNMNDPNSRVAQLKKQQRNYVLLEELNVRPRTSYLAKLRNPSPDLASGGGHGTGAEQSGANHG